MQIQLVRSATLRINYANQLLLVDPYLAARFTRPSYTGASPNPLVELPFPPEEVISGAGLVLISHMHSDHFDPAAKALLPRDIPIACQPSDRAALEQLGFRRLLPLEDSLTWNGITITGTPCQHGSGTVLDEMGSASGFVLRGPGEPVVYWAGDTVWCPAVAEVIAREQPDVIVTHSCGAVWGSGVLILMDAAQTVEVCRAAPGSTVVATHMEALDHATVSRAQLRAIASSEGISAEQLRIPLDGEILTFTFNL